MVRDASGAPTIEDFARDTGIVAETGAGLTQGIPNGSVSQMGVQKENAAGGVFEGQAAQSENATGVESDEALRTRVCHRRRWTPWWRPTDPWRA